MASRRDEGALRELAPERRPKRQSPEQQGLERLRKRHARLEEQLAKHKQALAIQGKASELLARRLAESDEETRQQP